MGLDEQRPWINLTVTCPTPACNGKLLAKIEGARIPPSHDFHCGDCGTTTRVRDGVVLPPRTA